MECSHNTRYCVAKWSDKVLGQMKMHVMSPQHTMKKLLLDTNLGSAVLYYMTKEITENVEEHVDGATPSNQLRGTNIWPLFFKNKTPIFYFFANSLIVSTPNRHHTDDQCKTCTVIINNVILITSCVIRIISRIRQ